MQFHKINDNCEILKDLQKDKLKEEEEKRVVTKVSAKP
jgi:hypothetical protein